MNVKNREKPSKIAGAETKFVLEKRPKSNGKMIQCTHTVTGPSCSFSFIHMHTHPSTNEAHDDEVLCLAAFESVLLASGSKDKSVKIWDIAEGKLTLTLTEHDYHVKSLAYGYPNLFSASKFVLAKPPQLH